MAGSKLRALFLIFGFVQIMTMQAAADGIPPEVQHLTQAVQGVPGISSVEVRRIYLPDLDIADLSLPGAFADLPAAALRRSDGGLPDESLLSINFEISRNESGLKGLEFLAWWARDQARSGHNIQLRTIALPPVRGGTKQLGKTLRFTIDWFYENPSQDMRVLLGAMEEAADSLESLTGLYNEAFQ